MDITAWILELLLKCIFVYGGYLSIKGEINIGALGKYRVGRWTFALLIWSVVVIDTYQNYVEGKYF